MRPPELTGRLGTQYSRENPSPNRLESLDDVRRYIDAIDLSAINERLRLSLDDGGRGWSAAKADFYEPVYRNWLFLRRKYEGEVMPPQIDFDEYWHGHIIDTFAYHDDCDRVFGYYFHHYPGFGTRDAADAQALDSGWDNTQERYKEEYGDYIYDFDA
jgi:hypothetical protein